MSPAAGPGRHAEGLVAGLLALLAAALACASSPDAPALPQHVHSTAEFLPTGWRAERLEQADFNRDGRLDVLLLLRREVQPGAIDPLARTLAVALATRDGYTLAFKNSSLIPHHEPPAEDPLADGELKVVGRGFRITLVAFAGAGSYVMANLSYTFHLRDGCFRLVTYDRTEVNRATLDTVDTTVDYVRGRLTERRSNAQSNHGRSRTERIRPSRTCAEDLGNAWKFKAVPLTLRR